MKDFAFWIVLATLLIGGYMAVLLTMKEVTFLLLFVLIVMVAGFQFLKWLVIKKTKTKQPIPQNMLTKTRLSKIPPALGIRSSVPGLKEIVERLENSLDPEYMRQVKLRVLRKDPLLHESDYEWRLFELKRFFVMNAILQSVPMYSSKVDEIWHEMLMFTKEYQNFCEKFVGRMIHHIPHVESENRHIENSEHERAWFDLLYGLLFEFTPQSNELLNGFHSYFLDKGRMREIKEKPLNEIIIKYFRSDNETIKRVATAVCSECKERIKKIESSIKTRGKSYSKSLYTLRYTSTHTSGNINDAYIMYSLLFDEHDLKDGNSHRSNESIFSMDSTPDTTVKSLTSYFCSSHSTAKSSITPNKSTDTSNCSSCRSFSSCSSCRSCSSCSSCGGGGD
jgi:hypothetical protein